MVTTRTVALVFGVIYLLTGILGFVPGISTTDSHGQLVLGFLASDTIFNIVHVLLGLLGIGAAYSGMARIYCQVVGVVLLLLTVLGFITVPSDGLMLGLLHTNIVEHVVHLISGAILTYFGFFAQRDSIAATR